MLGLIADHAVGSVDHFIRQYPGQAKNQIEKRRGNNAIRQILSRGFNRRPCHGRLIQRFRITPDDHRDVKAGLVTVRCGQSLGDTADMVIKAAASQKDGDQDCLNHKAGHAVCHWVERACADQDGMPNHSGKNNQKHHANDAAISPPLALYTAPIPP